ncbi:translation initiation factor eIF4e [Wallemia mellicola]|nr:translation initiation factor eIF4e [Wallemia mellicola]TIC35754.1 translation initiation factor eIF4e [Wallemia mellicola]TIC40068.1 translation initiation factor eIF4e [Wallemia mellicola]TIC48447.1 translation initiation factor eIF4e [Wallemia mellicola]
MTLALRTPWTVWGIHRPPSSKIVDYEKDLIKVASFDSVESFWNTYSYLNPPSTLPVVTDYQLFRSGVRPVWEDPENIKGGKWILRLKKGIVDQLWEDLVLAIIGGSIAGGTDDICGAVVSIRAAEDIISFLNHEDVTPPCLHTRWIDWIGRYHWILEERQQGLIDWWIDMFSCIRCVFIRLQDVSLTITAGSGFLIQENRDYGHEAALASSALLTLSSIRRARKGARLPQFLTALGLASGAYYALKIKQFQDGF